MVSIIMLDEPGLKRSINLFQAVMYGVGLILGAGIYVLIGDVAAIAGNAIWASFAIAAIIAAFTGLSYAELSSMFPKSAAEYVFVKSALRNNMAAFIAGWLITFVAIASAAAVAIGFAGYLSSFFPQLNPMASAIMLVLALSLVNFIGIRQSIWMNTAFTFIELAGLAIIVFAALWLGVPADVNYYEMPSTAESFPLAAGAIVSAAGLIFFAYFGFENLANIAEETKNASRVIPKALIISIAITTGIYIIVAVSAVALVGWEKLSASDAPLALAAEGAFGKSGVFVLSTIALFATSNTVLMMLISASRIMFGMSKGNSLPTSFSKIYKRTGTPWISVLFTMAVTMAVIMFSGGSIAAVANAAVFAIFLVYALVNFVLIWLRYKEPLRERQFSSPLKIGRFPILAGLGFVTSLAMLTQFDAAVAMFGLFTIIAGVATYAGLKYLSAQGKKRKA